MPDAAGGTLNSAQTLVRPEKENLVAARESNTVAQKAETRAKALLGDMVKLLLCRQRWED